MRAERRFANAPGRERIAAMFEQEWNREQRAGRKADRQSALLIVAILLSFTLVDSLSTLTEFAREGEYINPAAPWLLNLTSVSILTALIPVMLWTASRAPVTAETWRWSLPVHLGVSLVLSLIHVCLLYTSPSPRDATLSRMPSSA